MFARFILPSSDKPRNSPKKSPRSALDHLPGVIPGKATVKKISEAQSCAPGNLGTMRLTEIYIESQEDRMAIILNWKSELHLMVCEKHQVKGELTRELDLKTCCPEFAGQIIRKSRELTKDL